MKRYSSQQIVAGMTKEAREVLTNLIHVCPETAIATLRAELEYFELTKNGHKNA
jgi:hypothetical protein